MCIINKMKKIKLDIVTNLKMILDKILVVMVLDVFAPEEYDLDTVESIPTVILSVKEGFYHGNLFDLSCISLDRWTYAI